MTTIADKQSKRGQENYKVVGTRPIRHDGLDKVTGRAKYGADIQMAGQLHGKVLRSPHAHARIKRIDTSKAEALQGVRAVVTHADLPTIADRVAEMGETQSNVRDLAENCLANGKALYRGHAVAAVAATTPHIAELALDLIEVEYEVLKPVLTAPEAMKADAPLLHESQTTQSKSSAFEAGADTGVVSNIAAHVQFTGGDIAKGFREAHVVIERELDTKMVHQGYIEPHNSTVHWARDGRLTVWTSTQGPFQVREQVAQILALPESQVKVVPMEIGGGFGGKFTAYLDPVAALLSRKSGHPVKTVMSRKDVFEGTGPTSGSHMKAKVGATRDGKITAMELYLAYEAGAYPGSAVGAGSMTALGPYNVENFQINGYDVVVNKPKTAAYRAPGAPIAAFAIETVIDEVAEKLGMDPMDLRLKNATREGDRQVSGVVFPKIGCIEVEEAIRAHPHYKAPLGPNQGRGVAMGWWFNAGLQSSCTMNVNSDGSVSLITGSVDIGGTRASVAMQAAEVLGIAAEDVIPSVADTDSIGWTFGTGGSRTAFSTGIAAIETSRKIVDIMKTRAALIWETQAGDVEFRDGTFVSTKNPADTIGFKEMAGRLMATGGPVSASAASNPLQVGSAFAGHLVDVEVDPETGKVEVLRYTAFQDVGQAGHLSYVEGQIQGGVAQGVGWALNEEYFVTDDGTMANSTFLDYRMPTTLDLPMIETVIIEVPNPGHPFGLRGVGEVPIVPPMAAMANAIHNATGKRMTELPMNPGSVLKAIHAKG